MSLLFSQQTTKEIPIHANTHLQADSFNLLARKYLLQAKQDSAKMALDKATALALLSKNSVIIARCYVDYATMYNMRSKFSEAHKYLIKAQPYLSVIDNYEINIAAILLQAHIYSLTGRKDSAIYLYHVAEKYNIKKNNTYRNYVVYMSMGELYSRMGDEDLAEDNLKKAYALTSQKQGKPDHGYLLIIYINYHLGKKKSEGAGKLITEYNQLMEEREKHKFQDPLKNIIMNLTDARLANSIDFMKEVRESSISKKDMLSILIADAYIIRYYEGKNNYSEAFRFIAEAEQIAKSVGAESHFYEIKKMKFALLQKADRDKEAVRLADTLFTLKDTLLALEKRSQLYELEKKYETEKKQKEIDLLAYQKQLDEKTIALLTTDKKLAALSLQQRILQNFSLQRENELMDSIVSSEKNYNVLLTSENKFKEDKLAKEKELLQSLTRENILQAKRVKKEKQTKWLLAGGAFLVLISGAAIYSLYRRQKTKSTIIQKQASDLEVLMKEIHHRVKNNLQVVSSLLDLQSHYITDAQAVEAVKEGKNRVQSMALIHQNLYSDGNISGIQVKEYIGNLLKTLCQSYNITNDKVSIHTNIDDLNLDIDTMIPLGLVLNELVSNSFKYAFKDKVDGELAISLTEKSNQLHLMVKDNGNGFPAEMDTLNSHSFGLKMLKAFSQKLKAQLKVYNNNGAVVEMHISKYKMA